MYSMVGHQPATIQTITLAADKNGKLTGIRHDSISREPEPRDPITEEMRLPSSTYQEAR